jgi:carboxymethylenebutenolidase
LTDRYERITAPDGGGFDAFCAIPGSGSGPGMVRLLFQEIFGINDNMRGLAERLAGEGFVTLVPDMFWRLEPRFERKDESGLSDAFAMVQAFDRATAGPDMTATLAHLRALPERTGPVGVAGFCFGGTLAYLCAATTQGRGPDAAVSYYGSGVHSMLDLMDRIECPLMFHYGTRDPFIPGDQVAAVEAAAAGRPNVTLYRYDAGHAFSNWDAPSMYDKEAADLAWERTVAFLDRHLKGGAGA